MNYDEYFDTLDESVRSRVEKRNMRKMNDDILDKTHSYIDSNSKFLKAAGADTKENGPDEITTSHSNKKGSYAHYTNRTGNNINVDFKDKRGNEFQTTYADVPLKKNIKSTSVNISRRDSNPKSYAVLKGTAAHEIGHSTHSKTDYSNKEDRVMASIAAKHEYENYKNRHNHNSLKNPDTRRDDYSEYFADKNARKTLRNLNPKRGDIDFRRYLRNTGKIQKFEKKGKTPEQLKRLKANRVYDMNDRKSAIKEFDKAMDTSHKIEKDTIKYKIAQAGGKDAYKKQLRKVKQLKKLKESDEIMLNLYEEALLEGYLDGLNETPKCDSCLTKKQKIRAREARQMPSVQDKYLQLKSGRAANVRKRLDYNRMNHGFNPTSTNEYSLNEANKYEQHMGMTKGQKQQARYERNRAEDTTRYVTLKNGKKGAIGKASNFMYHNMNGRKIGSDYGSNSYTVMQKGFGVAPENRSKNISSVSSRNVRRGSQSNSWHNIDK